MSNQPQEGALTLPLLPGNGRTGLRVHPESPTLQHPRDEELLVSLQAPDRGALGILFDRYARLIFSIALRILKDPGEAEDAVQDTFFRIYERAALFDPTKGSARAWILQMAFHRALDRKSYLMRRNFYVGTPIDSAGDTLSGATNLDREIGSKLLRAQLQRAFADLADAQRRTLEMFYFEGLELREIARKLNEPLGNVRHHYYRALEHLRNSAFVKKLREDRLR